MYFHTVNVLDEYLDNAADGSFVDMASGSAARGFKIVLDQYYGVSVQIRSPYAITGFVNQHGQQRYRVGYVERNHTPCC